jgi:hypothetical protein
MGSSSNTILKRHFLHPHPTDIDRSLNETVADKIRDYRTDYNNRPSNTIPFIPDVPRTSDHLHCEFVHILFLQTNRETDRSFTVSGVQFP